ncbi:MAG: transcriptional regulator GutM [Clostridia bacterium]
MAKLATIAFLLLIVQGLLAYLQICDYRKRLSVLKLMGMVGIGTQKGILGSGNITILACDKRGRVVRGEKLEGITIFERFKEIKGIEGLTLDDLKERLPEKKVTKGDKEKKSPMLQAIESLEKKLKS